MKNFGGDAKFKIQIKNDQLKRKLCKEHGVILYEIPYWYNCKKPELLREYVNNLIN